MQASVARAEKAGCVVTAESKTPWKHGMSSLASCWSATAGFQLTQVDDGLLHRGKCK